MLGLEEDRRRRSVVLSVQALEVPVDGGGGGMMLLLIKVVLFDQGSFIPR